ncbi:MAG: NAD-dependent epimerase/dehydratase family protein, partial [Planctomycetota bacterium]
MAILITGGTGFLGRHVLDLLCATADREVRVLSRSLPDDLPAGVVHIAGSVMDSDLVREATRGASLVLHLAGRVAWGPDAHDLFRLHVGGTRNVLRAAEQEGVTRLVYASTSGTVGISEDLDYVATSDSPWAFEAAKRYPYYFSKIIAEREAMAAVTERELPVMIVNPALLLGPGRDRHGAQALVGRFLRKRVPAAPPGVAAIVDVRDAASALLAATHRGRPGVRYLLGHNITFSELFDRLSAVSGVSAPWLNVPRNAQGLMQKAASALGAMERGVGLSGEQSANFELSSLCWAIDDSLAREELGVDPRPLDETLRDAVEAYRGQTGAEEPGTEDAVLGEVETSDSSPRLDPEALASAAREVGHQLRNASDQVTQAAR